MKLTTKPCGCSSTCKSLFVVDEGGVRAETDGRFQPDVAHVLAAGPELLDVAKAAFLFHSGSPWDAEKVVEWKRLTGKDVATTRDLCDAIRAAVDKAEGRS